MTDAANTHLPLVPSYDSDVDESYIRSRDPDLLRCLLLDRSMTARNGRPTNIKWAVDDYAATFPGKQGYCADDEIAIDAISGSSITSRVIVPRVRKRQDEQRRRSAEKAEVFTPSWVCKSGKVEWHNGVRCRVMDWEIGKPVLFMPPFEFKPIEEQEAK